MTPDLIASYRVQLRSGIDFDAVADGLDYLSDLGISHLYLSPIFTATTGSTHGYDVTDPGEIDPCLGGAEAYARLAGKVTARGMGIILDLVPNHTALTVENPWMLDVLRNGEGSRYARHFDIDWSEDLMMPFLADPLDEMIDAGKLSLTPEDGGRVTWEGGWLPLAPGTLPEGKADAETLRATLAAQHWRLRHWQRERDSLTHRRFFNVTTLIGMRIERPEVFDDIMGLPIRLVKEGLAQGLRIDHVDGLADPATYMTHLRDEVGPDVPVWVEKILTGDEAMPESWPVEGTTGYEASGRVTALLTPEVGVARLDRLWRAETGYEGDYADTCRVTRPKVLSEDLATELHRVIAAADDAFRAAQGENPGPEALREVVVAWLCTFPRYRSYGTPEGMSAEDRRVLAATRDSAAEGLREPSVLDALVAMMADPETPEAARLVRTVQQVTGALVAKSQEDCAFFRFTRLISACEVGAEPGEPSLSVADFQEFARSYPPRAMILGSSHDTKRGEDARCRLIAAAWDPERFHRLWQTSHDADPKAPAKDITWYVVQSALAMWEDGADRLADRLADHMTKALREARQITTWPFPDEEAEAQVTDFARALVDRWQHSAPDDLHQLMKMGETLSLDHLVLRFLLPGMPDIYQGSEAGNFTLTDPDNRHLWKPGELRDLSGFAADKKDLTRRLIALRREAPDLFADGSFDLTSPEPGRFRVERSAGGRKVTATLGGALGEAPEVMLDDAAV